MVNRSGPGHSSDIDKNANVGLEDGTEGVEEPTMRVDLFLVLLLQTEQNLDWDVTTFVSLDGERRRIDGNWGSLTQLYGTGWRRKRYVP